MKTIKTLLPAALTFALFMGLNNAYAQSATDESLSSPLVKISSKLSPKKAIGLHYSTTLVDINEALSKGVKSDYTIDYQGKLMVDISLNAKGAVTSLSFNKNIPERLESSISKALRTASITPVSLNGIPKPQTFKIPLIIK